MDEVMLDTDTLVDVLSKAFANAKAEMASEDAQKVLEHVTEIQGLAVAVQDIFRDGLQLSDLSKLGTIVGPLMQLAASFEEYKGLDKKRFVTEAVWLVYRTIDTWPDGNHNNINVPFVFGTFERKLERGVVCFAAGMAVDALYGRMKSGGEV
jgi:hypothetical protein